MLTRSQDNMVKISLLTEISKAEYKKTNEQPDTTDMHESESEEPAERKRK